MAETALDDAEDLEVVNHWKVDTDNYLEYLEYLEIPPPRLNPQRSSRIKRDINAKRLKNTGTQKQWRVRCNLGMIGTTGPKTEPMVLDGVRAGNERSLGFSI